LLSKDELFLSGDQEAIWNKYCGFLDLSPQEFRGIQEHLLLESLELTAGTPLARRFLSSTPRSVEEFRATAPLTGYAEYEDVLSARDGRALAVPPEVWAMTSGRSGNPKWVPYPERFIEKLALMSVSALILACAGRRGEVKFRSGLKVLLNLPSPPYMTGILHDLLVPIVGARVIPPPDRTREADFETKIQEGFAIALRSGVDILSSMTSVLVRMGESFTESSGSLKASGLWKRPRALLRLASAWMRARREGRSILPRDLWPLKGLICYGMDTQIYRERLKRFWGLDPFESYGSTETGVLAVNGWRKGNLTFLPYACYLEFLPVDRIRDPKDADPGETVTYDGVETGRDYEVVVTSFYGMPFLRYRLGDIVRFVATEDAEAGIRLPQAVFQARASDLIDVAGFVHLDEKTVWQAIAESGLPVTEWTMRKESTGDRPSVRLFLETRSPVEPEEARRAVTDRLAALNGDWRDMVRMLGVEPLSATIVPPGSFERYYQRRKREGAHLAHLKPPHMNPHDSVVAELLGGA